jgi:hypothetical protein
MLQKVFEKEALSRTQLFEWFAQFEKAKWAMKITIILGALQQDLAMRMLKILKKINEAHR